MVIEVRITQDNKCKRGNEECLVSTLIYKYPQRKITRRLENTDIDGLEYFFNILDDSELNFNSIDGAIAINYYECPIMGFRYWDSVDQLWAYLLDLIIDYLNKGTVEMMFPDQPVKIKFTKLSDKALTFNLGHEPNPYTVQTKDFFQALISAAEEFFKTLSLVVKDGSYKSEIDKIGRIKDLLKNM